LNSERQTLRNLLTDRARRFEKKGFLDCSGRQFSFAEVDDRTDRVATGLSRLGLQEGDRVALLMANRPEYVFFLLGAPKLGIIPVPLDPALSQEEIVSTLWHSGAKAVVTERTSGFIRPLAPQIRDWIVVDEPSFSEEPFRDLERGPVLGFWPELDPSLPAVILHTRGRCGTRRAVVLTHRNLLANCSQILQPFRVDETDRFLCMLSLGEATALVLLLLVPWMAGADCVLREPQPSQLPRFVESSSATVVAGRPELYDRAIASPGFARSNLSSLRLALCTSGPVGGEPARQFELYHDALIVEGYGLVEATCLTCANPYTGVRKAGSLGLPLPGQECRIADDGGRDLPPGRVGEILVRGPNVMREYFRDPASTARTIRSGWLHTGDMGYMDSDGFYHLCKPDQPTSAAASGAS